MKVLEAVDIANCIAFAISMPEHVCIREMVSICLCTFVEALLKIML